MKKINLLKTLFSGLLLLIFTGSYGQLSIPNANPVTINFTGFDGTGFAPIPAAGQLNSDDWIVTGLSDGAMNFGDEKITGDFARGSSTGGVTSGGVYAFNTGGGNMILGVQPTGSDWASGSFILRIQNNTGSAISQINISYSIFVYNDGGRATGIDLAHSADNVSYTTESTMYFVTPEAADASVSWTETKRSISITSLNIPNIGFYYIKWQGSEVSGSGSRDEFGLDNITLTTAPVFNPNTPRADDIRETQFDVVVNLNEIGTVYFLVKNDGDPAPTLAEVRLGDTLDVSTANSDFSTTIDGLTMGTNYDVYFLAEDDEPVPNVQDTTTLLDVRTNVPRALDLIVPVGGETFFVGDTTIVRWNSDGMDSLQLWVYDFEELVWHPVLGDEDAKVYAEQDSLVLPIPRSAGLDSTYFRLSDADDFNFFDSCGVFYLTDTLKPRLMVTLPANHKVNVGQIDTVSIAFDEEIFPGDGNIFVLRKADHSVFDSIPVSTGDIDIEYNIAVIHLKGFLETGIEYYIMIDPGSFVDYQDNEFAGIQNDTTWTFTTIGADLFISEYLEGISNNKAIEIANTTGADADLSNYELWRANSVSGVVDWNNKYRYPLSGILKNDSVFVICNASAIDEIKLRTEVIGGTLGEVTYFNGDDAVAIVKMIDGKWTMIDAVGVEGPDPGTAWSVAGVTNATAEHTLLRKSFINNGNIDWSSAAGTSAFDSEWKVYPQNYYENLGLLTAPEDTLAEIKSFSLAEETGPAVIDSAAATIDIEVVMGTQLNSLFPVIVVSPGAAVTPVSGDSVDFSKGPVLFTVTAEDHVHTKVWTVTVTVEIIPSSENDILSFILAEQTEDAVIDTVNHTVNAKVMYGTSLIALTPAITVSAAATIDPASGVEQDFTDPVSYTVTAQDGTPQVWIVIVTVQQPVEVSTIADLRAGLQDGTLYKLTGEGIITAMFEFLNTKYIQDASAGIQIYDPDGIITTSYDIGYGITGIIGTLQEYNGMLEFTPKEDPRDTSSMGNEIIPIELTVDEFLANSETYESRIIKFTRVMFPDAGSTFANGKNYNLVQGIDTTVFRTQYYNLDYIGTVIPQFADVTGIGYEYRGTPEIVSRFLADIVEVILSSEKDILTFVLTQQTGNAVINSTDHTVHIEVATGTNVTSLSPVITLSTGASIDPESGTAVDFTNPVTYTVTAEDGSTQDWTVTVTVATSLPDNFLNGKVHIYPNPNNGKFYLTSPSERQADYTLQVLNLDGRIVYNREFNSVNLVNEPTDTGISEPGVYFVRIISGTSTWTGKLVIQ